MAIANSNLLTLGTNTALNAFTAKPNQGVVSPPSLYSGQLKLSGSPQISGLSSADQMAVNNAYKQGMTPTSTTLNPYSSTQTSTPMAAIQGSSTPVSSVPGFGTSPAATGLANTANSVYGNQYTNNPTGYNPTTPITGLVSPTKATPVMGQTSAQTNIPVAQSNPVASTGSVGSSQQSSGGLSSPGYTPPSTQNDTTLVYDKTTGQPTYVNTANLSMNMDRYSLTPPVQSGENPAVSGGQTSGTTGANGGNQFGTPSADTSTYQGLIQQAAAAQAASRNFNQNLSNAMTGVTQTGSDLPFQTGAQAGLQREYGAQAQALSQAGSDALSLAGLAKPSPAAYGQTVFNPMTGQYTGNASGGLPDSTMQQYAQMAANGQYSAIPSSITSNPQLSAELNAAAKQINPNYNPVSSTAQGGVQTQQIQQVEGYKSALQQASNLQAQLSDLITSFGLNPNDVNAMNSGLQLIARNTSSPQYQMLSNYVNDIANTYAQVLTPSGGAVSDMKTSIATSMLDATAKGESLISVMKALDQAAQAKIAGVQTVGTSNSVSSGTGGNSIYSF